jgi:hypothetical protein
MLLGLFYMGLRSMPYGSGGFIYVRLCARVCDVWAHGILTHTWCGDSAHTHDVVIPHTHMIWWFRTHTWCDDSFHTHMMWWFRTHTWCDDSAHTHYVVMVMMIVQCVFMLTCIHEHVHICMYIRSCIHICTHVCMRSQECMCRHQNVNTHIHTRSQRYAHTHSHTTNHWYIEWRPHACRGEGLCEPWSAQRDIYVCICVCVYLYICMNIYTQTNVDIHLPTQYMTSWILATNTECTPDLNTASQCTHSHTHMHMYLYVYV